MRRARRQQWIAIAVRIELTGSALRHLVLLTVILFSVSACQSVDVQSVIPQGQWLYPEPPETTRYRHVFELRRSTDIQSDDAQPPPAIAENLSFEDKLRLMVTTVKVQEVPFLKPIGVAARGGHIFVSDSLLNLIHVYDIPRRRYFQFGVRREGALEKPLGIGVDNHNQIYVADAAAGRVIVFDFYGLYLRDIGGGNVKFARPISVASNRAGDRVYVLDNAGVGSDKHRVFIFDGSGAHIGTIGRRGRAPGQFNLPRDLSVGRDGTLFVLDAGNFRVQAFDPDGNYLFAWGAAGDRPGQFSRPRSIAADDQGHVFVSDAGFGNIQVFTEKGQLLMPMGRIGRQDLPGNFAMIAGVATDEDGRLYALDQFFRRLSIFAPEPLPAVVEMTNTALKSR